MSDNTPINLTLTFAEVNGIVAALGELPTKTNAIVLIQKIADQAKPQLPPEEKKDAQV